LGKSRWPNDGNSRQTVDVSDESERTLAQDEAMLRDYAAKLTDAVGKVATNWLYQLVDTRLPGSATAAAQRLDQAASELMDQLSELLAKDIADQAVGPLELLRRAVSVPTEVLAEAGVAPVERDPFAMKNFPDDIYGLTPANFGEVDPSLHEPGLVWGAAKAHVHLRRRRES